MMKQDTSSDLQELLDRIVERYGAQELHRYLSESVRILQPGTDINNRMEELLQRPEEEKHQVLDQLMAITRAYYEFLLQAPEEIQRFMMLVHGLSPAELESLHLEELGVELQEELARTGPMIQAIRPHRYVMSVDAVSNSLSRLQEHNEIYVGRHGKQPVRTAVSFDCPEHMKIDGNINLSNYDKSIINGVSSILESGNSSFTIPMLYHAMTGKANPTVDDQLLGEIQSKLDKMRRLTITIDLSEEFKAHFIGEDGTDQLLEDLTIEGYLLPLNKLTGVVNGKKSEMYQIIDTPPLYSYARAKKQIATVPLSLLNAPVNNTATTIPLKSYLLFRIEGMKNKNNRLTSDKILYTSIYSELDDADASKTRKMRIRNYTKAILDHFVREKYIQGYSELRAGRSIEGVRILL